MLSEILNCLDIVFHLASGMIRVLWEVMLTRVEVLVISEVISHVLSWVDVWILIMVNTCVQVDIFVV